MKKSRKAYYGSSRWESYFDIVEESKNHISVEILHTFGDGHPYKDVIATEYAEQVKNNSVRNLEFFNLSYATQNSFSEPGVALYRHRDNSLKKIRLAVNDPAVLSGEYIHNNTGNTRSSDTIEKWIADVASKPKSPKHRKKIGRTGFIMLKSVLTGESKRILKSEANDYDRSIWFNPYTLASSKLDEEGFPIEIIKSDAKSRLCEVNDTTYKSISEAARGENVTRQIAKYRFKNEKWPKWKAHEKTLNQINNTRRKTRSL